MCIIAGAAEAHISFPTEMETHWLEPEWPINDSRTLAKRSSYIIPHFGELIFKIETLCLQK